MARTAKNNQEKEEQFDDLKKQVAEIMYINPKRVLYCIKVDDYFEVYFDNNESICIHDSEDSVIIKLLKSGI